MKEEILILAKTYPTFSKKHFELVCTAGINKHGEWRRIYPVPFRELKELEKYKKYQWIEVDIERNLSDPRPESYKLKQDSEIIILTDPLSTKDNWILRKEALKHTPVYTGFDEVIQKAQTDNSLSLCQFKPAEISKLQIKEDGREWCKDILQQIAAENSQRYLFEDMKRERRLVNKLPYKFSYQIKDDAGTQSTMMIEDWEIGALYWKCLEETKGNEAIACQKVKEKYEGFIQKNDVILFLGTTLQFHSWGKNPFIIIGVFYPLKTNQLTLF